MNLSPWKFFIGPGVWREQSTLYRTLDEAIVKMGEYDSLGLVPSGHAPWKPFLGRPATDTSPLRAELIGLPWQVLRRFTYRGLADQEPSLWYLAGFTHPADAFAFAEMKAKHAAAVKDTQTTFWVCLWAWTEDGRHPEIARLPADHLTRLRQAAERERARRDRLAEKKRWAA